MVHLLPTDGYPDFPGIDAFVEHAVQQAVALEKGGVHGLLLENDNDHPHTVLVKPKQIACFLAAAKEIKKSVSLPIGFDVLLNDWQAALDLAKDGDGTFIRVDVFVDRVDSPAGHIEPEAEQIIAHRKYIDAEHIAVFADIQPKHKKLLEEGKDIAISADQACSAGADALIVSGPKTGIETAISDIQNAKQACPDTPILIGSGLTIHNATEQLALADGAITGTAFKGPDGNIDSNKVIEIIKQIPI